jgi:hypothetical protein
MAVTQQHICKMPIDLNFILSLPVVKRVPFLSIVTHTELEDRSTFLDQIVYILEGLSLHPGNAVS